MIPLPPWLTARVGAFIALAVLVAGVVANTYRLSAAVDRERANSIKCQIAAQRLQDTIDEQNGHIEAWKAAAVANTERAAAALAEAERAAAARRQAIADLENWRRAAGENECDAARRLLREYRK